MGVIAVGEAGAPRSAGRGPASATSWDTVVDGLDAIVWERDAGGGRVRHLSERAGELLGHPPGDETLWAQVMDAGDRDRVLAAVDAAAGAGGDLSVDHRMRAGDGRVLWVRQLGRVTRDDDGRVTVQALLVDLTEQKRREHAFALLAGAGSALAGPGTVEERLRAVAELAAGHRCDWAAVWLREDDGRYRAAAAAPTEIADRVCALAPLRVPDQFTDDLQAGRAVVVPEVPEQVLRDATSDAGEHAALAELGGGSTWLAAPLIAGGPVLGLLTMTSASSAPFDDADVELAADLGRRLGAMVAADRLAGQRHQLHELHVRLSAAGSVAEAAAAVSNGLRSILGASVVSVCTAPGDGLLHTVDVAGYPVDRLRPFATIRMSAGLPLTDAARTRRPVWLCDGNAIVAAYPVIAPSLLPGTEGLAAMPLLVADRLVGALGVTFLEPRPFDAQERAFLLDVAGKMAMAFERAGLADARREMAETLQRSLLPGALPALDDVAVAARYLPAVAGTSAGGDWYDVLALEGDRVAVVVGDVVGHGAPAAAVMGQLRSALATLLLAGFPPARALELLDRFADQVDGAAVATVACVLLDPGSGRLTYSCAGHPPPLVIGAGGGCLEAATGPALGVAVMRPRTETEAHLRPGATLLLYTDGLVEQRGASLDDGLARLSSSAARRGAALLPALVDGVLSDLVDAAGAGDDIAVVALRLRPARLRLDLPAQPSVLSRLRRAAAGWAAGAGLDAQTVEDLQLALGEAAGNSAEHAYRDAPLPGSLTVELDLEHDGAVAVRVADSGSWRPVPADPGFRGRGLAMIKALTRDVELEAGETGTVVRFRLGVSSPAVPTAPEAVPHPGEDQPATVVATGREGVTHLEVAGDLDQAGVAAVRDTLLTAADGGQPMVVDLAGLGWLTSVGIGLLLDVAGRAGSRAAFVLPSSGPARRVLDLTGVTAVLHDSAR